MLCWLPEEWPSAEDLIIDPWLIDSVRFTDEQVKNFKEQWHEEKGGRIKEHLQEKQGAPFPQRSIRHGGGGHCASLCRQGIVDWVPPYPFGQGIEIFPLPSREARWPCGEHSKGWDQEFIGEETAKAAAENEAGSAGNGKEPAK
ncbi:hypothetical protein PABG_02818 [Paracoccidioides brasiliensis Pb03]|nr:hypothetical protein PABG_02818 [Paracoccidioides brasiliensis Pb03]